MKRLFFDSSPQHIFYRFILWFSLLGMTFFSGLSLLRQDPEGIEIQSFFVPSEQKEMSIPIYFSSNNSEEQFVVETEVDIVQDYTVQNVSLLIKRPLSYIDVYWDQRHLYSTPIVDGARQGMMSVLILSLIHI